MIYAVITALIALVTIALVWPLRRKKPSMLMAGTAFALCAAVVYTTIGSPQIVYEIESRLQDIADAAKRVPPLLAEVKKQPENAEAWASLGLAYMLSEKYEESADAYKQSIVLSKGEPRYILQYAKAQIFAAHGEITTDAMKSLDMVLLQVPEQPEAQYFKAIGELQAGNTKEAMNRMKTLYRGLPDDSPLKQIIQMQIGRDS